MISSAKRWAMVRAMSSAGGFVVLLAEDLRVGGVAGVIEPAVDGEAAVCSRERAEGDHGGVGGVGRPLREIDLLRRAGRGLGIEALRDHVEDAGVLEIAEEGGVEGGLERGRLRVGADLLEVGCGEADARVAEARTGVDPILCGGGKRGEMLQARGMKARIAT